MAAHALSRLWLAERSAAEAVVERAQAAADASPAWHRHHLRTAAVACLLLPLSTMTPTIGLLLLLVPAILRFQALMGVWRALLGSPIVLTTAAFFVWSAISIAWAAHPAEAWETLRAQRYVLLLPLLAPMAHHLRVLAGALLVALVVQSAAQVAVYVGWGVWSDKLPWHLNGGFSSHSSGAGIWAVICTGLAAAPALGLRCRWHVVLAAIAIASLLLTGGRTALFALMAFVLCVCVFGTGIRRSLVVAGAGAVVAVLSVAVLFSGADPMSYVRKAFRTVPDAITGTQEVTSASIRWGLWQAGLETGLERPVVGWGLGASEHVTRAHGAVVDLQARDTSGKVRDLDMHSSWVGAFLELGAVGVLLYLVKCLALVLGGCGVSLGRNKRWGAFAWSCTAAVLVFGLTNVLFNSGQFEAASVMASLLLIAMLGQPAQEGTAA